ncbi:hypothetical protein [Desulfovibrio cuneatus]|uniref:hypothetical protein n=1 Tax=Desulfovibrio cuneatus TaxID=159728 RepID=UPI0004019657|nr:hypothetical protein [Desulfovibrio cuneatus]
MSMHQVEFFVEVSIVQIAESNLPVAQKRNLVFSLLEMQSFCDCGFTNLRVLDCLVECEYTAMVTPTDMPDYEENKEFYATLADVEEFEQGDVYLCEPGDDVPEELVGKVCVDSGSFAWEMLGEAGMLHGAMAEPIEPLGALETLLTVIPMLPVELEPELEESLGEGRVLLAIFTGALDEANDEQFKQITGMTRQEFDALAEEELEKEMTE